MFPSKFWKLGKQLKTFAKLKNYVVLKKTEIRGSGQAEDELKKELEKDLAICPRTEGRG